MACFGKSLAGAGYVVLNVIRVMNIISLLAVIAASAVMLVKTFIISKFFFFDACGHVIEIIMSGFLIITELPLFKKYFARNWPLFSHKSGFVMLGCAMLLIGNGLLANLNKPATTKQQLGLPFWRVIIAAGIIVIVMGSINLFASYIFRDKKIGLTARQVRSHGAVATHKVDVEHNKRHRSFFLGKRDTLPSYYSQTPSSRSIGTSSPRSKLNISSPITSDKCGLTPDLTEPSLAHHPAMTSRNVI